MRTHGRTRRSTLSWSRSRVSSFSLARRLRRASIHSLLATIGCTAIACLLLSLGGRLTLRLFPGDRWREADVHPITVADRSKIRAGAAFIRHAFQDAYRLLPVRRTH